MTAYMPGWKITYASEAQTERFPDYLAIDFSRLNMHRNDQPSLQA